MIYQDLVKFILKFVYIKFRNFYSNHFIEKLIHIYSKLKKL